jgi:hypothetical protein
MTGPLTPVSVTVPIEGEFFVRNGKVQPVDESELTDHEDEGVEGYQIWVRVNG